MTRRYNPRTIMVSAWKEARRAALCHGGKPAQYLAACLRWVWQFHKDTVARSEKLARSLNGALADVLTDMRSGSVMPGLQSRWGHRGTEWEISKYGA